MLLDLVDELPSHVNLLVAWVPDYAYLPCHVVAHIEGTRDSSYRLQKFFRWLDIFTGGNGGQRSLEIQRQISITNPHYDADVHKHEDWNERE